MLLRISWSRDMMDEFLMIFLNVKTRNTVLICKKISIVTFKNFVNYLNAVSKFIIAFYCSSGMNIIMEQNYYTIKANHNNFHH